MLLRSNLNARSLDAGLSFGRVVPGLGGLLRLRAGFRDILQMLVWKTMGLSKQGIRRSLPGHITYMRMVSLLIGLVSYCVP